MLKQMKHISIIVLEELREGLNFIFNDKKQRISETNTFFMCAYCTYTLVTIKNLQRKEIFLIFSA